MQTFAFAGLVLALIVTVAALVRQVQIRRALEMLLRRVLERIAWNRPDQGPPGPDAHDRRRWARRRRPSPPHTTGRP